MNLEQAAKASRNGAIAATISGVFTAGLYLYATTSHPDGILGLWDDSAILLDIVVIVLCAIGMLRRSRAAAIVMCLYWIMSRFVIYMESGELRGLGGGLIFLYFYVRAVQGSFTYHKLGREADPEYRAAPKWIYVAGIPALVVLLAVSVFGMLTLTDYVPSTEVVAGSEVPVDDRNKLVDHGVLYQDEQIEHFYSYGVLSVLEGGNVLSDRAVITYYVDENDELTVYELTFDRISSIELLTEGDFFTDAVYKINAHDEDAWITVELSVERGGDDRFIEALRARVREANIT